MKNSFIVTFLVSILLVVGFAAVANYSYAGGAGSGSSGGSGGTGGKGGGGGSGGTSQPPTGSGTLSGSFTTDPAVSAAISGAANSLCGCNSYTSNSTYSSSGGWGYSTGWSGQTNGGGGGGGGFGGGGGGGGIPPECRDGKDNADPEDTVIDAADPGCHTDGNATNPGTYNPNDTSEINVFVPPVITGATKGCWINRPSPAAASCAMICGGAGGLASADPKGAQCMSGEARPASGIAALGSGRPPYWWGCWPGGSCATPNVTQTTELTFPTTVRTCVGGFGGFGCSGRNAIGTWVTSQGPPNSLCYAPGQKRDGDTTDLTAACFCQVPVATTCSSGSLTPTVPTPPPVAKTQCNDGKDNTDPEDTLIDATDPGCHTDANVSNAASYNAADNDETDVQECFDGFDNDGDGKIDFANDPDCVTNNGTSEAAPPTITANGKSGGIIVRSGTSVVVDWKTNGGTNCSLSSNVTDNDSNPNNNGTNSVTVQNQNTYTITCNGLSDSVTVQVLPVIYES